MEKLRPALIGKPGWEKNMIIFPTLWGETKLTKIVREFVCIVTVIKP